MSRRAALVARGLVGALWCLTGGLTASPALAQATSQAPAPPPPPVSTADPTTAPVTKFTPLSDARDEEFLLKADQGKTRAAGKGITGSLRMTMTYQGVKHDAHIQLIDESKREFKSQQGTEFNFRDYWGFNIAGYKIDRLLGLNFVPVSVERRYRSNLGAFTWWLDDVMMDEGDRLKKKISPPAEAFERWNQEMQLLRLFDQLIANVDRNLGNLMITKDWNIWAIDHTRAFRTNPTLKTPGNIARCDRQVFARLKQLDKPTLSKAVGRSLQSFEIDAILKRRDAIVAMIEQRGESGLFDRLR
jgi:hypothetical protein